MIESAGLLLYQRVEEQLRVLLVHPAGNYNRRAPWSIPKGLPEKNEDLETAARRETREETGISFDGDLKSLGSIQYTKSRKRVHAFAGTCDHAPCCASWEIDKAEFVSIDRARELLHLDQRPFLDRLIALLGTGANEPKG